ncbi:MAG: type VI-D CRISPR-associated RNA-guided ribonuclease Cas13d, partial [Lachnospiraceae bacterium]|nr:type VI-D CRISPR-associated RNA-guided ribonuclease Cas13d [Lachnospiraceae bacterium]
TKIASRFDNISSFLEVSEQCGISISFRENYQMFIKSREIAEEIRVINSFARMTDEMANVPKVLMEDAVVLLGLSKEEGAAEYAKQIMEENHEFRNFLINNVIQSSRFQYLVRYSNPKNVRMLANVLVREGNPVLKFILKRIPRPQLIRYYESCTGEMDGAQKQADELIESLANIIREVDIRKYETVRNSNKISSEEKIRKERTKNILGLYLTVLFLLQKNLTNVNARYVIAFHCFERDAFLLLQDWMNNEQEDSQLAKCSKACMELLTGTKKVDDNNNEIKLPKGEGMIEFTRLFYSRKNIRYKKRVKEYVDQNINNACKVSILAFRNNVAHLNVIRNSAKWMDGIREVHSYFELYHYMMQKCLLEGQKKNSGKERNVEPNERTKGYFSKVEKHGTYCKDFVKALNVPFAYNLPRYKNLSINELFDQNDYLPDKAKGWDRSDE